MSALSNAVNKSAQRVLNEPAANAKAVAAEIWDSLDAANQASLGITELAARIKRAAVNMSSKQLQERVTTQMQLPLNVEGAVATGLRDTTVQTTLSLCKPEFLRVLDARSQAVKKARAREKDWKFAYNLAKEIWEKDPSLTFEECLNRVSKRKP